MVEVVELQYSIFNFFSWASVYSQIFFLQHNRIAIAIITGEPEKNDSSWEVNKEFQIKIKIKNFKNKCFKEKQGLKLCLKAHKQVIHKWAIYRFYVQNQKILVSYNNCENFKGFSCLVLEIFEIKVLMILYGSPMSI